MNSGSLTRICGRIEFSTVDRGGSEYQYLKSAYHTMGGILCIPTLGVFIFAGSAAAGPMRHTTSWSTTSRVCIPARLVRARSIHNTCRIHSILRARTCMYSSTVCILASRSMCCAYYALHTRRKKWAVSFSFSPGWHKHKFVSRSISTRSLLDHPPTANPSSMVI